LILRRDSGQREEVTLHAPEEASPTPAPPLPQAVCPHGAPTAPPGEPANGPPPAPGVTPWDQAVTPTAPREESGEGGAA
jgi:hypothetical protein